MKKSSYHVGVAQKSGLHMIQKGSMVHAPSAIMDDESAEGESMGGQPSVNRPVASKSAISSVAKPKGIGSFGQKNAAPKFKKGKKKPGFFGY